MRSQSPVLCRQWLITFCIFPCAANTKPRIEDATSLFKKKGQTKEEEDEEANEIEMAPAIESPKTKTKRKGPKTKPTSRDNSKASPAIESPKTKTKRMGPKTKPTSRGNSKASAIDGSI